MAHDPPLLASPTPSAVAPANVSLVHIQLKDLVVCPQERGVVNTVRGDSIVEYDLVNDSSRIIAKMDFIPNTLTALPINSTDTLLAAGGQQAELHLSYHTLTPNKRTRSKLVWQNEQRLDGSINNSVLLTSLNLSRSGQSAVEPRMAISNNDYTVRLYDVPLRIQSQKRSIRNVGTLLLDVPINHSSISPDGRTLLSVGDSTKIYFHHMRGGDPVTFERVTNLMLPPPNSSPLPYSSSFAASFSTSFSSDGMKFAVASQAGVLAVWDVRSSKPMKVFQTDKWRSVLGDGSYLSDDPTEWTRPEPGGPDRAPPFSVRNVKFGGGGASGKEVMIFTEHTSLLHVVDARTFETEQILKVPSVRRKEDRERPSEPHLPTPSSSPPRSARRRPSIHRHVFSSFTPLSPRSPPTHLGSSPSPQRLSNAPAGPHIYEALNDAFRITTPSYSPPSSISDSTWRTLRLSHVRNTRELDDYDEIVVVPALGDRTLESEVHALLNARPTTRRDDREDGEDGDEDEEADPNTGSSRGDYAYQPPRSRSSVNRRLERQDPDDMEMDELEEEGDEETEDNENESDCISSSSHVSRSGSPIPRHAQSPPPSLTNQAPGQGQGQSSGPQRRNSRTTINNSKKMMAAMATKEMSYPDDLELAGTCFDPSGRWIYAASTDSVVEWSLRDTDKKWWLDSSWR